MWVIRITNDAIEEDNDSIGENNLYFYAEYDSECCAGWSYYVCPHVEDAAKFTTREKCLVEAVKLKILCQRKDSNFYIERVDNGQEIQ